MFHYAISKLLVKSNRSRTSSFINRNNPYDILTKRKKCFFERFDINYNEIRNAISLYVLRCNENK